MLRAHAHHIVFQEARTAIGKLASKHARRILEEYDIDWYRGVENFVWAPYEGHTDRNIIMLAKKLFELKKAGASRLEIVQELQRVGKRFADKGSYYP